MDQMQDLIRTGGGCSSMFETAKGLARAHAESVLKEVRARSPAGHGGDRNRSLQARSRQSVALDHGHVPHIRPSPNVSESPYRGD